MGLISKTVTTKTNIGASPSDLLKIQSGYTGSVTNIAKKSAEALSNISSIKNPLNQSTVATLNSLSSSLGSDLTNLTSSIPSTSNVNSYLQSALKSITSTFDSGIKGLAAGIDSTLSGLFKDTNVKSASTITTLISDPIKTNLIDKKIPASSAFKISSFAAGSQPIGGVGSFSEFGSNVESMISTNLSTVMDRLNFDSINGLGSGITDAKALGSIKGLLSPLKNMTTTVRGVSDLIKDIDSSTKGLSSGLDKGISNTIQSFVGRASSLANLTGKNSSDYYIGSDKLALKTQTGTDVSISGNGVDYNTANSILAVARYVGCDTGGVNEYSSVDELSSLFNMILSLAAESGLTDLVDNLLGCSMADSSLGQRSVVNALSSVAATDISMTNMLIGRVTDSTVLYKNRTIARDILSNTNLTSSDTTSVTSALANLNYTPTEPFEISTLFGDSITVYDDTALSLTEKSLLDSLFNDKTVSTYLNGSSISILPDGTYSV